MRHSDIALITLNTISLAPSKTWLSGLSESFEIDLTLRIELKIAVLQMTYTVRTTLGGYAAGKPSSASLTHVDGCGIIEKSQKRSLKA